MHPAPKRWGAKGVGTISFAKAPRGPSLSVLVVIIALFVHKST